MLYVYLLVYDDDQSAFQPVRGEITENWGGRGGRRGGVNKVLRAFVEAWNRHEARAFSVVFAEDADFTNVAGNSKREIEKHHDPSFKWKWKDSHQAMPRVKFGS